MTLIERGERQAKRGNLLRADKTHVRSYPLIVRYGGLSVFEAENVTDGGKVD